MSTENLPGWLDPVLEIARSAPDVALAPRRIPHPPTNARPAAVLMLFSDGEDGPELLLTRRSSRLRHHAGQFSFPGGGADPGDADVTATALREAYEEVGLDPASVQVLGQLPEQWLAASNYAVTPVLAYWRDPHPLGPVESFEVAEVHHTPISSLVEPDNRFMVTGPSGWRGPAFEMGADIPLWGFTAGIIARLLDRVGWSVPWDESVTRPLVEPW